MTQRLEDNKVQGWETLKECDGLVVGLEGIPDHLAPLLVDGLIARDRHDLRVLRLTDAGRAALSGSSSSEEGR